MKLIMVIGIILFGGCAGAPLTDEQQYDKDDKETLRLEQFYRDERACMDAGGIIVIQRWGTTARQHVTGRLQPPSRWDNYGCVRGGIF